MDLQIAPLRSLDDFLLASSRFQVPDFQNVERWFNRIINNLMYYQTNYILSGLIIFLLVTYFHPHDMLTGLIMMGLLFSLSSYAQNQKREILEFKKKHPLVVTLAILTSGYYLVSKIASVIVFGLGVLLPVCFVIVHASLRLRNVKNKFANVTEALGFSKTSPMGFILRELGIEYEIKSS